MVRTTAMPPPAQLSSAATLMPAQTEMSSGFVLLQQWGQRRQHRARVLRLDRDHDDGGPGNRGGIVCRCGNSKLASEGGACRLVRFTHRDGFGPRALLEQSTDECAAHVAAAEECESFELSADGHSWRDSTYPRG